VTPVAQAGALPPRPHCSSHSHAPLWPAPTLIVNVAALPLPARSLEKALGVHHQRQPSTTVSLPHCRVAPCRSLTQKADQIRGTSLAVHTAPTCGGAQRVYQACAPNTGSRGDEKLPVLPAAPAASHMGCDRSTLQTPAWHCGDLSSTRPMHTPQTDH
jgi:hypothetical protein